MRKVAASSIMLFLLSCFLPAMAVSGLVLRKVITGNITPKSIVHSGNGYFFAQNMMYRHSITIYNREYQLVKTLPDKVRLADFGFKEYKGEQQGAPVEAAMSPDGRYAWVSNYAMYGKDFTKTGDDACPPGQDLDPSFVYKINLETLAIEDAIRVGAVPKFVAVTADGRYLLVSNWCSGDLSVIDISNGWEVCRLEIGLYPRGIAVDPLSEFAYVALMGSSEIAVIDLRDFSISYLEQVGRAPRHLCISPDGRFLYASLNHISKVVKIDLHTFRVVKEVNAGITPRSMAISADGEWLYVVHYKANKLSRIRTRDMKVVGRVDTREKPIGVTFDPQDRKIWVACYTGNIMVFEDTLSPPPLADTTGPYQNPISKIMQDASLYAYRKQMLKTVSLSSRRPAFASATPPPPRPEKEPESEPKKAGGNYCIVLQSFQKSGNAQKANASYKKQGLQTRILPVSGGWHRVAIGAYPSAGKARTALGQLKSDHDLQGWVLETDGS